MILNMFNATDINIANIVIVLTYYTLAFIAIPTIFWVYLYLQLWLLYKPIQILIVMPCLFNIQLTSSFTLSLTILWELLNLRMFKVLYKTWVTLVKNVNVLSQLETSYCNVKQNWVKAKKEFFHNCNPRKKNTYWSFFLNWSFLWNEIWKWFA